MSRSYPKRPLVGVGVVIWYEDKVLLVRRGKAPRQDEWSLPGGAQQIGETVRDAALREVEEETNLKIEIKGLIDVVDAILPDEQGKVEYHYTLVDFAAIADTDRAIPKDDVADLKWVDIGDISSYDMWDETVRIIKLSKDLIGF